MFVYVLECKDKGHVYVGITSNFEHRLKQHICGKGAAYTKRHGVSGVLLVKSVQDKSAETAMVNRLRKQPNFISVAGGGRTTEGSAFIF